MHIVQNRWTHNFRLLGLNGNGGFTVFNYDDAHKSLERARDDHHSRQCRYFNQFGSPIQTHIWLPRDFHLTMQSTFEGWLTIISSPFHFSCWNMVWIYNSVAFSIMICCLENLSWDSNSKLPVSTSLALTIQSLMLTQMYLIKCYFIGYLVIYEPIILQLA